jgi:hypothetical protein
MNKKKKQARQSIKKLVVLMDDLGIPSAYDYTTMNSGQLLSKKDTILDNIQNWVIDLDWYGKILDTSTSCQINVLLDDIFYDNNC